jgi:hypothetical protein
MASLWTSTAATACAGSRNAGSSKADSTRPRNALGLHGKSLPVPLARVRNLQ